MARLRNRFCPLPAFRPTLLLTALIASAGSAPAQTRTLPILNSGGIYAEAIDACLNKPFEARTGIKVIMESPGGYAKMAAQAKAGVIANTLTDGGTSELSRMISEGLLLPVDWKAVDPLPMFEEAKHQYGFGASYYSTIMAWRSDAKTPANFVDFFDVEKFPGTRALPDYPDYLLQFAALAAGQTPEQLNKGIDLDKAFAVLNRIKKNSIFWQSGAQSAQLLKDNEAQYAIVWNGRVAGQPGISYSFKDGMLDISWWMVAKGITDEQQAMVWDWLHEQSKPEVQVCIAKMTNYPGPALALNDLMPQEARKDSPVAPDNKKVQWLLDGKWWFDNAAEIEKRWNEFKLQ